MMKVMKKILFLIVSSAVLLLAGCAGSEPAAPLEVRILHYNDSHSHFDPHEQDLTFGDMGDYITQIGGMANIAALVEDLRMEKENVLTLHAGDAIMGTTYFTFFNGDTESEVMNAMGFDAMTIGNHEFDLGDAFLADFIGKLDFPVISANVVPAEGNVLEGLFEPYMIKEFQGQQVGIIGLTIAKKTAESSSPSDEISFMEEGATVQKYVDKLKKEGVRKIIVLAHDTYEKVSAWAPMVTDVDVIVSGDSHTRLGDYESIGLSSAGSYPSLTANKDGEPVYIVQAWDYAKALGALDVVFEGDIVTSASGRPYIPVSSSFAKEVEDEVVPLEGDEAMMAEDWVRANGLLTFVDPQPEVQQIIAKYQNQKGAAEMEVIAQVAEDLGHNRIPEDGRDGYQLPLGSDIAPIVAKAFYEMDPNADLCIQNAGGVRVSIGTGDLTLKRSYELLPFSNTMYELDMTGDEIKAVLEDALSNALDNNSTGSFPYAYGIRYDVDGNQEAYNRVSNLEIMDRNTGEWGSIQGDKTYVVVTNDYIAGGKDGYLTFAKVQEERGAGYDTMTDYALSFIQYARRLTSEGKVISKLPPDEHPMKSYIPKN